MIQPETEVVETDVLILGGGMAGCGSIQRLAAIALVRIHVGRHLYPSYILFLPFSVLMELDLDCFFQSCIVVP